MALKLTICYRLTSSPNHTNKKREPSKAALVFLSTSLQPGLRPQHSRRELFEFWVGVVFDRAMAGEKKIESLTRSG